MSVSSSIGERIVHKKFPPITRHRLALYCGASGDHNPIHVDLDFAKKAGFPDVFSHGMLVMAYLGQALTDAVRAVPHPLVLDPLCRDHAARRQADLRGHRRRAARAQRRAARGIALTTKDEAGEIKLAGEAIIAL